MSEKKSRAICYRCGKSVPTKSGYDRGGGSGCAGLGYITLYYSHNGKDGNFCRGSNMFVRPVEEVTV